MAGYIALEGMESREMEGSNNNDGSPPHGIPRGPVRAVVTPKYDGSNEKNTRDELLTIIKDKDESKLKKILTYMSPEDLNYVFDYPEYGAAIHIATVNSATKIVSMLLEAGADPNIKDHLGKTKASIHYAVDSGNCDILELLLSHKADPNMKAGDLGRTSLHILASEWDSDREDHFRKCLDMLLCHKKIKVDLLDIKKTSPLIFAAKCGLEYMTKELVLKGASLEVAVKSKTIKDIINDKFPKMLNEIDFSSIKKLERNYAEDLYEAVTDDDIVELREIILDIQKNCKESKISALNESHGRYTPLQYACNNGLEDIVTELLKEGADPIKQNETTGQSPILYASMNGYNNILDKLIKSLGKNKHLEKGALKLADGKGETPLHKVVKREGSIRKNVDYYKCLQLLLAHKKYLNIDALDEFDFTPLHYAVLCDDQTFVRCLLLNGANLGIKNSFGTLAITRIQPSILKEVLNECVKSNKNVTDREFEIILYYKLLAPSGGDGQPETDCLKFLSESKAHRHLLLHPIIDTFLFLKWQRIRPYFYFNIITYLIYLILITAYVCIYHGESEILQPYKNGNIAIKVVLQIIIMMLVTYIAAREIIQFLVSWKLYILKLENWVEISIIILTTLLLLIPLPLTSQQSIAAWLILFSWIECVLLVGRHPKYSVYITMFTTVSFNFLKFILMFSMMVVSFSISFYIIFQKNENFETYTKALFKTIGMSTGELEYTELPLNDYPVSSHLLFVVFVFLIVLVLMNLLNGLAVSDIQEIRQEAEIVSYRSRVELISYIESVFLSSPFQKICCEPEDCILGMCFSRRNPFVRILNWMGKRTLMFGKCLQEAHITMYPNRQSDRWKICDCHTFQLQESQIESAKSVVLDANSSVIANKLDFLENRIEEAIDAISAVSTMIQNHVIFPPKSK